MADHLRKYESMCAAFVLLYLGAQIPISITPLFFLLFLFPFFLCDDSFTLTPPRMRMIVDAFKDTLELGLEKPKQVVVRFPLTLVLVPPNPDQNGVGDTTA